MRFELSLGSESSTLPVDYPCQWPQDFTIYGLSWLVTVTFQNIAACKLLFFVKNKGQWNAKSGPKVGDGKVAENNLRDVWCRNESVRAETILHTHTHTRLL